MNEASMRRNESLRDLQIYADNLKMAQQIRGLKLLCWTLIVIVVVEPFLLMGVI